MYLKNKYKVTVIGIKNEYSEKLSNDIVFLDKDLDDETVFDEVTVEGAIIINAIGFLNATNKLSDINIAIKEFQILSKIILKLSDLKAEKFIQLSSGGTVYGDVEGSITEDIKLNPINLYGVAKSFIENYLQANFYENGLKVCIVRVANPFGGYQLSGKQQGIIPILIEKTLKGEELTLWTSTETIRDYIYIEDFLHGLEILIEKSGDNDVYNLGSGVGRTIKDLVEITEEILNKEIIIEFVENSNFQIKSNILNLDKINNLGFNINCSLEYGILQEINRIKMSVL